MANEVEKLMRQIVRSYLAPQEAVNIDLDASASDPGHALAEDKQKAMRTEERRINRLADSFQAGLQRAHDARRVGGTAISLDDRREEENYQAEALVHFLVRTRLATSMTRETDDRHYIYTISIDWDALERVAREARINLAGIVNDDS